MNNLASSPLSLAERLSLVKGNIARAQTGSPLSLPQAVILGASKGQSAAIIKEAIAAGLTLFGENRVQEAQEKWPELRKTAPYVKLHLIGPLQTNKAKEALSLFDAIQTIDRVKLADALAEQWSPQSRCQEFYIQVNTGQEPQKAGIDPKEADDFISYCLRDKRLPVVGLMCVPPHDQPPAPHFALLRSIGERHGLSQLSMGMSEDYDVAVRMGSSCVRLGRVLFGERG
jgi:pyridoxal phosphate enzyme (YggS family)